MAMIIIGKKIKNDTMNDITNKITTLRLAIAQATVSVSKAETIAAIINNKVPKGNIFEQSKAAGLLAIKKTSDVIPDCHPMPIEYAMLKAEVKDLEIHIIVEVKTIYKTGVEVEAMHGAAIAALTIYDMLKPIDKGVEIKSIKLIEKKGGKTDYKNLTKKELKAAVIVCSDSVSKGLKQDKAGIAVKMKLEQNNINVMELVVIPDDMETIQTQTLAFCNAGIDLILLTGGTGLSSRDNTPDAIRPLFDKEIPGIMEAARSYGMERTPYAMLSRGIAGLIGKTLIITLPGSLKGADESMNALFPFVIHLFNIMDDLGHES